MSEEEKGNASFKREQAINQPVIFTKGHPVTFVTGFFYAVLIRLIALSFQQQVLLRKNKNSGVETPFLVS